MIECNVRRPTCDEADPFDAFGPLTYDCRTRAGRRMGWEIPTGQGRRGMRHDRKLGRCGVASVGGDGWPGWSVCGRVCASRSRKRAGKRMRPGLGADASDWPRVDGAGSVSSKTLSALDLEARYAAMMWAAGELRLKSEKSGASSREMERVERMASVKSGQASTARPPAALRSLSPADGARLRGAGSSAAQQATTTSAQSAARNGARLNWWRA